MTHILRAFYACCERQARFATIDGVARETYTRRCPGCETTWNVERQTLTHQDGFRIDRLVWTDTKSREFFQLYG